MIKKIKPTPGKTKGLFKCQDKKLKKKARFTRDRLNRTKNCQNVPVKSRIGGMIENYRKGYKKVRIILTLCWTPSKSVRCLLATPVSPLKDISAKQVYFKKPKKKLKHSSRTKMLSEPQTKRRKTFNWAEWRQGVV